MSYGNASKAMLRAEGQEGAAETMARQERTLGSMADAAAAACSEHARRLDQQRRRDAAPLLITPHRCRHRVFASNSSLPSSCGRSSTMKSSLHACAADCTVADVTLKGRTFAQTLFLLSPASHSEGIISINDGYGCEELKSRRLRRTCDATNFAR